MSDAARAAGGGRRWRRVRIGIRVSASRVVAGAGCGLSGPSFEHGGKLLGRMQVLDPVLRTATVPAAIARQGASGPENRSNVNELIAVGVPDRPLPA